MVLKDDLIIDICLIFNQSQYTRDCMLILQSGQLYWIVVYGGVEMIVIVEIHGLIQLQDSRVALGSPFDL